MRKRAIAFLVALLVPVAPVRPQGAPPRQVQEAIESRVTTILATQGKNGSFFLREFEIRAVADNPMPVHDTALAMVALQRAKPRLKGKPLDLTSEAIRKGLGFITSKPLERQTHSAGLALCALVEEDPDKYEDLIKGYAEVLVLGQIDRGDSFGQWGYYLPAPSAEPSTRQRRQGRSGNHRSTLFALVGLWHAQRAGLPIPKKLWERTSAYCVGTQSEDGGWGDGWKKDVRPDSRLTPSLISLTNLVISQEMLAEQCKGCAAPPDRKEVERGLQWVADNWEKEVAAADLYAFHALRRLEDFAGNCDTGSHKRYTDGVIMILGRKRRQTRWGLTPEAAACHELIFLSVGKETIAVGKLRRRDTDDWNNTPGDVRNLVRRIGEHIRQPVRWGLVDLETPLTELLEIPILHISGHQALDFNFREKEKLKAYVTGGGTLLAQACCGKKAFDRSFREFVKDVFYDEEMAPLDEAHPLYERMKINGMVPHPAIEAVALKNQAERLGVIYLPSGLCRSWHREKKGTEEDFAAGVGIYDHVIAEVDRMRAIAEARVSPILPKPETAEPPPPWSEPAEPDDEPEIDFAKRYRDVQLTAVRSAIVEGVTELLKTQEKNGEFDLNKGQWQPYRLGSTALAVLTLQHAMPYLEGKLRDAASDAVRKGLAFIKRGPLEARTYSAGLIICALYKDNPRRNRALIRKYANGLAAAQHYREPVSGMWGYIVQKSQGKGYGDNSNTQFAILGLYYAARAGAKVPDAVWKRAARHYLETQLRHGGWSYKNPAYLGDDPSSTGSMTLAGVTGLHICREMLYVENPQECKPPHRLEAINRGLALVGRMPQHGGGNAYTLYSLERLGTLMGRSNFGPYDWYDMGAGAILASKPWHRKGRGGSHGTAETSTCFSVLFLARGLAPIIINKLERRGTDDWNNTPYDVKHLVEDIEDRHQFPCQWRIVTLEAPLELLLRTPVLHISGHEPLDFNDEEKAKLKAYVSGGGTILAQACCGRKEFDASFRKLVKELFADDLRPLPATHRVYERMDLPKDARKPKIEFLALDHFQGRPVVFYLPRGLCRQWHLGGKRARDAFVAGAAIYSYVANEGRKMHERTPRTPLTTPQPTKPGTPAKPDDIPFPGNPEPDEKRPD